MTPTPEHIVLFEQYAMDEALPLTPFRAVLPETQPARRYLWDQTQWRFEGFCAALTSGADIRS